MCVYMGDLGWVGVGLYKDLLVEELEGVGGKGKAVDVGKEAGEGEGK